MVNKYNCHTSLIATPLDWGEDRKSGCFSKQKALAVIVLSTSPMAIGHTSSEPIGKLQDRGEKEH